MSLESLYGPDPPEPDEILCPVCGDGCETIYLDDNNEVAGCENCIMDQYMKLDAAELMGKEKEVQEADEGDRKYHEMKDEGMI